MLCTLQLHPHLFMMESQPSTSASTATIAKLDPNLHQQNTAHGRRKSSANPTSSTPPPTPTSVVQRYVTNAAEIVSSPPATWKMFLTEVSDMCLERAKREKEAGIITSTQLKRPVIKLPQYVNYTNYNHGQITPPEVKILDHQIDNYATPYTSTSPSGSTHTVTVGSNMSEPTTTTTTSKSTEGSTPHAEWRKTTGIASQNCNTSGSMMRKGVEQGLPNQVKTLFALVGMAEDLTKVQLILCNEIKTEPKAVKESIAANPFDDVPRKVTEATTMLEERMSNLEDQYNKLKELVIHRTAHNLITDPTLLDHWNPADMVMKHSSWMNMRLVLDKVASENIADLCHTDWHPRPTMSNVQEKQYKVLTEVMTDMFKQCGYLPEECVIEMDNYQDFLKV